MKNGWLLVGLMILVSNWISSNALFIVFLITVCIYYVKHYKLHPIFFFVVFVICIQQFQINEHTKPMAKILYIKEIKSNYVIASTGEEKVVLFGLNNVNFDDVIEVEGDYQYIRTIHNIREFSFEIWLNRRSIYYQMNVKTFKSLGKGTSIRHTLYQHIMKIQNKDYASWVNMMLYGIHEDDVSFFITSSGMHISFLMLFLQRLLERRLSKKSARFVTLICIGCIAYSTVFSSTLIRILCFYLISFVFDQHSRYDQLGLSMSVVLMMFPYMAYELAFLLPVGFRLISLFNVQKRNNVIVGLIFMIPMQFQFFHSCNPIQILLFRFFRIGYACLYLMAWGLIVIPMKIFYDISLTLYQGMKVLEGLGFVLRFTPGFIWLIVWGSFLMNYLSYKGKSLRVLCAMLMFVPFATYIDPFGEILMIDVGQGDCTLVRLPFHQGVMLIDVMGSLYKNVPKDIIVPILQAKGITYIDKVIITHDDYDHSGGLKQLQELIPVHEVIQSKQVDTMLGNLRIPFMLENYQGKDTNENSIITYLEVYGVSTLFMGDVGSESEKALVQQYPNIQVDILKAGHHGSNTSSSLEFLHQIHPKIALISAGRNNRYHHPSTQTLERMKQEDILPLITSKNGAVSIKFCKYFAFFRTADNEFGIINNR